MVWRCIISLKKIQNYKKDREIKWKQNWQKSINMCVWIQILISKFQVHLLWIVLNPVNFKKNYGTNIYHTIFLWTWIPVLNLLKSHFRTPRSDLLVKSKYDDNNVKSSRRKQYITRYESLMYFNYSFIFLYYYKFWVCVYSFLAL